MKRTLLIVAAIGLLASTAAAQWGRGWGRAATPGQTVTPGTPYERRLEFLATYLNLSEGQKAQFKSALEALQAKNQTIWQKMTETRTKLRDAVRNNAGAQVIQPLADALGKLHAELIVARAQTMATLRGLLTQEQRDKLDKLCPQGCGLGGFGGRGMGFGRRGWQ